MKGIFLTQEGHFVNVLPPIDIAGGVVGDRFHMKHAGHATIIVQVGVSAAAFTKILLNAADAASAGNTEAIGFRLYAEETAAGDTLGAVENVASTGKTPSANNDIFYVIELDASELPEDKPWVELQLTNPSGNSVLVSALAILTGLRYGGDQNPSAIV